MVKQLLDEVRAARARRAVAGAPGGDLRHLALAGALSPDLQAELRELPRRSPTARCLPNPSCEVAQAQLVGWLEGLFHGIQATLFAQQLAARQQLEQMRASSCPVSSRPKAVATGRGLP